MSGAWVWVHVLARVWPRPRHRRFAVHLLSARGVCGTAPLDRPQPMFTLEIAGKPIAVTTEAEAREACESGAFKADLMVIESEGAPIWDGLASAGPRPRKKAADFEYAPTRTT